jgi:hypothetical protein
MIKYSLQMKYGHKNKDRVCLSYRQRFHRADRFINSNVITIA